MLRIIAGNIDQAADYARDQRFVYISDVRQLHGLLRCDVHCIGTYRDRHDWPDIEAMLRLRRLNVIRKH